MFREVCGGRTSAVPFADQFFMILGHAGRLMTVLAAEPLLFDHFAADRMGSRNSGILLLHGLMAMSLANGFIGKSFVRCLRTQATGHPGSIT